MRPAGRRSVAARTNSGRRSTALALGGGCELAITPISSIAGENATFGQPEVKLGIMPGAGGTQRLVRAIGKYRAMMALLTGAPINAREAFIGGLGEQGRAR